MAAEDWLDAEVFDELLRDISEGGLTHVDESEKVLDVASECAAAVDVFHSCKDKRTIAKIRRQAEQKGPGSSKQCIVKKRKKDCQAPCQAPRLRLVAFPNFEKCDSLIYFPHTLARLVNSNDKVSLARLLNSYFAASCEFRYMSEPMSCTVPYRRLPDIVELAWVSHPDYMICVHDTKVVDNVISATTYFKYTECKYITDSVRRMTTDPLCLELLESPTERLKRELRIDTKSEQERQEICAILDSDSSQDVVVYGRADITLMFDYFTKKVVALQFAMHLSSVALPAATSSKL
jgi:hypothetical protein